jgi:hypothetical protein
MKYGKEFQQILRDSHFPEEWKSSAIEYGQVSAERWGGVSVGEDHQGGASIGYRGEIGWGLAKAEKGGWSERGREAARQRGNETAGQDGEPR